MTLSVASLNAAPTAVCAERLAALHAAAFAPARGWSAREITDLAARGGLIVAVADGDTYGFAMSALAADEAELLTIAVHDECRRSGVGTALLQAVVADAAEAGARRLFLEVAETNRAANSLYRRHGFAETGRRKGYYLVEGRRTDALILSLPLDRDAPGLRAP